MRGPMGAHGRGDGDDQIKQGRTTRCRIQGSATTSCWPVSWWRRAPTNRLFTSSTGLNRLAEPQGCVHSLIQIRALRALAMQAAGHHAEAVSELAEALALAPAARVRPSLRRRGRPTGRITTQVAQCASADSDWFDLKAATPASGTDPAGDEDLDTCGTTVRPGCRSRRRADQAGTRGPPAHRRGPGTTERSPKDLFVTIDTVKKHASHILAKLDATSRTHAVARGTRTRSHFLTATLWPLGHGCQSCGCSWW